MASETKPTPIAQGDRSVEYPLFVVNRDGSGRTWLANREFPARSPATGGRCGGHRLVRLQRPRRFIGEEIPLAGDLKSLDECRRMWTEAGRRPRGFPMPTSLFKRVAGDDLPTMWSWLRTGDVPLDTAPTRAVHPGARTLDGWLKSQIAAEHSAAT